MIKELKDKFYHFLRKSQKITGTDNIYLAKQGGYLTFGNFINAIISLLLAIAFARLLPKEIYGEYKYLISIAAMIALFSLQGMGPSLSRSIAQGFEKTIKLVTQVIFKWTLLGSLVAIGLSIYFLNQHNYSYFISLIIIALALPFTENRKIYEFYLKGKKNFGTAVIYKTSHHIISALLLIVTLFFTQKLVILILVYFSAEAILNTYFYFKSLKKYPPQGTADKNAVSYGKHLSLMTFIGTISQNLDKILLFNLLGPVQLAIYSFAVLPIQYLRMPLKTVQELAFPKLAANNKEHIKKTLPKKLLMANLIIIPVIILAYIIIAPYAFKALFPQYLDSVFYSQLFALDLLFFSGSMIALTLQTQKQTKALYKMNINTSVFQVILLVVLTPAFGILGVILARLSTNMLNLILGIIYFKKM